MYLKATVVLMFVSLLTGCASNSIPVGEKGGRCDENNKCNAPLMCMFFDHDPDICVDKPDSVLCWEADITIRMVGEPCFKQCKCDEGLICIREDYKETVRLVCRMLHDAGVNGSSAQTDGGSR